MESKKKNFTELEKNMLTTILVKFKDTIENKNTDGASVKMKNEAWCKVEAEFNSTQLINEKATAKQLQRLWTNMKQRQRAALSQERQQRLSTGGGAPVSDVVIDPEISLVAPHLLVEVPNVEDSDSGVHYGKSFTCEDIYVLYPEEDAELDAAEPLHIDGNSVHAQARSNRNEVASPMSAPSVSYSKGSGSSPRAPVWGKNEQYKKESEVRIRREQQLIVLDKQLYTERIAVEKAQKRKWEAEAEMAELELKLKREEYRKSSSKNFV